MKPRSAKFNPKRRICSPEVAQERLAAMQPHLDTIRYGGNPEHKRNPGDFGLTPPSGPRPHKTLCDQVQVFTRAEAFRLLHAGIQRGLISVQDRDGWPQNIWSVTESGTPVEGQLEGAGVYHGYPMPESDPLCEEVLRRWTAE